MAAESAAAQIRWPQTQSSPRRRRSAISAIRSLPLIEQVHATSKLHAPGHRECSRPSHAPSAPIRHGGNPSHAEEVRAGTQSPPRGCYGETVLYAVSSPMPPRAFQFDPENLVAQGSKSR